MPDDIRTQRESNPDWHDPLDDLIAPILNHDRPTDAAQTLRPASQSTSPRDPLEDLLPDAEASQSESVRKKSGENKKGKARRDFNNIPFPDASGASRADVRSHSKKSVVNWPFDQSGRPIAVNQSSKLPLGGWLSVVAAGLLIGPVIGAIRLYLEITFAIGGTLDVQYPGFNDLLIAEVLMWGALLVFQVVIAVLFFKRHCAVPRLMVYWLSVNLLGAIVLLNWSHHVFGEKIDPIEFLASPVVLAVIWIPYFAFSRRVKRTFGDGPQRQVLAKQMRAKRTEASLVRPKPDAPSLDDEIVLFTEDDLRAVAQKVGASDTCHRTSTEDRTTDAELIAESRPVRLRSNGVKRTERDRIRLGFLFGTLAVLTGLLVAQRQESRKGLNQVRPFSANEHRTTAVPANVPPAPIDTTSPIAIGGDSRSFFQDDGSRTTGSAPPSGQFQGDTGKTSSVAIAPRQVEDASPRTPEELFARVGPSVVRINVRNAQTELIGIGSGFFVRDDSTVITNFHVIEGAEFAEVVLQDGTELLALEAESYDHLSDIVVLHIRHGVRKVVRPLPLGLELPPVASKAYVIGAPKGLDHSFSEGSVSGRREMDGRTWIQTTAPISPGSSGSPMFNDKGLVIGMVTRFRVDGQNLNFAIASRHIHDSLPDRAKGSLLMLSNLPSRRPLQKQGAAPAKPVDPLKPIDDEDSLQEAERHIAAGVMRRALQVLDDVPDEKRGPRYWRVKAAAWFAIAKYRDSANCYSESLKLDNAHSDTWVRYATALRLDSLNNRDLILAACRAALKIDRNDARAYHIMGLTFLEKVEQKDAFKTALSLDEANLGTHYHLGCTFASEANRDAEARKHFKRALALIADGEKYHALNPESQRFEPGRLFDRPHTVGSFSDRDSLEVFLKLQLASVSEPEERIAICRDVLKSEPDNDVATISLGMAFRGLGFSRKDANMMQYGDALQARFRNELGSMTLLKEVSLSAGTTGILVFRK